MILCKHVIYKTFPTQKIAPHNTFIKILVELWKKSKRSRKAKHLGISLIKAGYLRLSLSQRNSIIYFIVPISCKITCLEKYPKCHKVPTVIFIQRLRNIILTKIFHFLPPPLHLTTFRLSTPPQNRWSLQTGRMVSSKRLRQKMKTSHR